MELLLHNTIYMYEMLVSKWSKVKCRASWRGNKDKGRIPK